MGPPPVMRILLLVAVGGAALFCALAGRSSVVGIAHRFFSAPRVLRWYPKRCRQKLGGTPIILSAAAGGPGGWLAGLTHGSADPVPGSWRIQCSGHRIHRGAAISTGRSGSRSLTVLLHLDLTILVCPETSAEPSQDWRARLGARVDWAKKSVPPRYCTQKLIDFWPLAMVQGVAGWGIGVLK